LRPGSLTPAAALATLGHRHDHPLVGQDPGQTLGPRRGCWRTRSPSSPRSRACSPGGPDGWRPRPPAPRAPHAHRRGVRTFGHRAQRQRGRLGVREQAVEGKVETGETLGRPDAGVARDGLFGGNAPRLGQGFGRAPSSSWVRWRGRAPASVQPAPPGVGPHVIGQQGSVGLEPGQASSPSLRRSVPRPSAPQLGAPPGLGGDEFGRPGTHFRAMDASSRQPKMRTAKRSAH